MFGIQARVRTSDVSGSAACSQLTAATQKVVVDVRLENVRNADTFAARRRLVLVDVTQRVDQGCFSVPFGDHQMGVIAEALVDELPDSHLYAPEGLVPLTRMKPRYGTARAMRGISQAILRA